MTGAQVTCSAQVTPISPRLNNRAIAKALE